jgi:cell division protein FtsI/penicillin-binding protein 2
VDTGKEGGHLKVVWDNGEGVIDFDGFRAVADARRKWKRGPWAQFKKEHIPAFLKAFHLGDMVPVQMLPLEGDTKKTRLILSTFPELNGGLVVLRKGMVKAMAGGFYNRFFNRAIDAKRQLGSMFKPIVYTAALQLNWNTLDSLQNMLNLYAFEGTLYVPRPDHDPASHRVSMAWAGAKSENMATVWLLYHLTDKLNLSEMRQVTRILGLGKKDGEDYLSYKERIRDRYGVNVNRRALMDAAFEQAKTQIESDLIFGGYEEMLDNLSRLHLEIDKKALLKSEEWDLKKAEDRQILQEIMQLSLDRMRELEEEISPAPEMLSLETPFDQLPALEESDAASWPDYAISPDILNLLMDHTNQNYSQLLEGKRYGLETLSKVLDFKALVNMHYVVYLAKKLGISTELYPVLSFPLGPYSVSITEAARAYQTILTGRMYRLTDENTPEMTPIITRIVDRVGKTLWEYQPRSEQVLSPRVSRLSGEILRKVMEIGTGKKARNAVKLFDVPVPSFGKTGTANRFTNSSFVGFIPGPNRETGELDMKEGYVICCYVGFDDNRPMKVKRLEIYGSSGALPLWIDTARAIVRTEEYKKNLEPADIIFGRRALRLTASGKGFRRVAVSSATGLPQGLSSTSARLRVLTECEDHEGSLVLKRRFEPVKGEKQ